jgi:uncharacterized protein YrrD
VDDLGAPTSYLVLEEGADVYASDGEQVGEVTEIRADMVNDLFEGIVVRHHVLGHRHFVDAEQIDEIHERGVLLTLSSDDVEALPEPD